MEAPIDEKNVMSDWLFDSLFDGEEYTLAGNEALGFVGGYPSYVKCHGNTATIKLLRRPVTGGDLETWKGRTIESLTGAAYEGLWCIGLDCTVQFIDEGKCCPEEQQVLTFTCSDNTVTVSFHWNVPRN